MSERDFRELVASNNEERRFLCVGLDPQMELTNELTLGTHQRDIQGRLLNFLLPIVEATASEAGMYKPNLGFYLQYGAEGIAALEELFHALRVLAPHAIHTLDLKGGDIGDTNARYLKFVYDICGADAATIHNYMGAVGMMPYLERGDKGAFVLCRTSNEGADEFQGQRLSPQGTFLFQEVADHLIANWNVQAAIGAVAGASPTSIGDLAMVRAALGSGKPILCPGVGKQGGKAAEAFAAGRDYNGENIWINASSDITHAHRKEEYEGMHWAEASAAKAKQFNDEIRSASTAA